MHAKQYSDDGDGFIKECDVSPFHFRDDGVIPNNPTLPLLIYPQVLILDPHDPTATCEAIFNRNRWDRTWRNGIFSYHHYHSNSHEVLAIAAGEARVHFGGEAGRIIDVRAGDVVVIPAGVGHKNLGASADLLVVGAYPPGGPAWDLCRGRPEERARDLQNIAEVVLPPTDPLYGADGPLLSLWE